MGHGGSPKFSILHKALTWIITAELVAVIAVSGYAAHVWGTAGPSSAKAESAESSDGSFVFQPAQVGGRAAMERGAPQTRGPASERPRAVAVPASSAESRPLPALSNPRILIRKSAGTLSVYDGPRLVKTYGVAVGENPGDKQTEGDRRTPEGTFYVCIRKAAPATPYVRSLGLSYPNAEDARRGLLSGLISRAEHDAIVGAVERGLKPPWETKLGGAIMIHGARNGREGTLGCVALDDADVRELYPRIPLGTPVTIAP